MNHKACNIKPACIRSFIPECIRSFDAENRNMDIRTLPYSYHSLIALEMKLVVHREVHRCTYTPFMSSLVIIRLLLEYIFQD